MVFALSGHGGRSKIGSKVGGVHKPARVDGRDWINVGLRVEFHDGLHNVRVAVDTF